MVSAHRVAISSVLRAVMVVLSRVVMASVLRAVMVVPNRVVMASLTELLLIKKVPVSTLPTMIPMPSTA